MSSRHTDVITRPVRRVLEDEIERLIAMLDEIDGDADLEPDADDEDTHDREEVCEDEGADIGDDEPSLGWGTHGGIGSTDDREEDRHGL